MTEEQIEEVVIPPRLEGQISDILLDAGSSPEAAASLALILSLHYPEQAVALLAAQVASEIE